MKKHIIILSVCILVAILMSACAEYDLNGIYMYNNKDIVKQDTNTNWGHFTAYDDGRIYYKATLDGKPGLYSMNEDGSDITLEIEGYVWNPIIYNDIIYYLAPYYGRSSEGYNPVGIFKKDRENNEIDRVDHDVVISEYEQIVSAYISHKENIVINCIEVRTGGYWYSIYLENKGEPFEQTEDFTEITNTHRSVLENDEFLCVVKSPEEYEMNKPLRSGGSLLVKSSGDAVNGDLLHEKWVFQSIYDECLYLSFNNKIIVMNEKNRDYVNDYCINVKEEDFSKNESLEGIERLIFNRDKMFVYTLVYNGKARLSVINKESGVSENIIEIDKFIGLWDDYILYENNNKIYKRLITEDDLGEEEMLLRVKHNYSEMCANWLFVYVEKENKINELTRINLINGETIKEAYHRTEND